MKRLVKCLINPRFVSALVSAVGALVSALYAGCKLSVGEVTVKDFGSEIYNPYNVSTNSL